MANLIDVAQYICEKIDNITAMKLEKLMYYCQVWSLVWDDKPMFDNEIEAWVYGPVIPDLYDIHRKMYKVDPTLFAKLGSDSKRLTPTEIETIDAVLSYYGEKSTQWLVELSHQEEPWKDARKGLDPNYRGDRVISQASIAEYYSSL